MATVMINYYQRLGKAVPERPYKLRPIFGADTGHLGESSMPPLGSDLADPDGDDVPKTSTA